MPEFKSVIDTSALNGRNGFKISVQQEGQGFHNMLVASAGDVNGDGFDDMIIGADYKSGYGSIDRISDAYVVFGKASGFVSDVQLSNLDGKNGFKLEGEANNDEYAFSSIAVASAGDINGDGFDDLVIGDVNNYSHVVFGKAAGFPAHLELSNLDGQNGFQLSGIGVGRSVAGGGDVNGDGFDDVIISGRSVIPGGSVESSFVVFGKASGFTSNLQLSNLNGRNGFQISGATADDFSRVYSLASAGDVNGDGFPDVMIGTPLADSNGDQSGASYVVFGKARGFGSNIDLSSLDGRNGFRISGENKDDRSGTAVASAGDINGDGFADMIVGAPRALRGGPHDGSKGASYVVFGKASGFASNVQLSNLDGSNGFRMTGEAFDNNSGFSVASAGDVNGDGIDDVIVGPSDISASGKAHVVFGKAAGFAPDFNLSHLDGSNGFKIRFGSGYSVASAGDVNGDGFADVMVGTYYDGISYVIFGHRAIEAVNRVGTPLDDTINGGRGDDTIRGLGGDDRLIAWEGNDLVLGNGGRDRLHGRSGFDRLIGGAGPDVLIGGFGHDVFDFNAVTDSGPTASTRDTIWDFHHLADKIDLSDLGNLTFIGTAVFTAPGQVRVVQQGPNTIVEINLSGDAAPEMTIALLDVAAASLTAADFIL